MKTLSEDRRALHRIPETGCRLPETAAYLHGDVIPGAETGWCLVTVGGYSLGWAKGDGKVLKNHYPKGLRR